MNQVIPFEQEYPEAGEMLAHICNYNAMQPKKNRLIVDFDRGQVFKAVAQAKNVPERNSLCVCGSGRKYKKCCMNK